MCTVEIFSRERAIFYTFPLQEIFFKYSSSLRNFQNTFFLFKAILPYKTLFKRLYLQHSYYLNQNFCYSLTSAPRCVKNLTYVWYLINLCQILLPLHRSKQNLDLFLYLQTYYLSHFKPSSFQILIIFLI